MPRPTTAKLYQSKIIYSIRRREQIRIDLPITTQKGRQKEKKDTDVVSLDVEVSEGDGDSMLGRRHDQPDTVLVRRVDTRVERTGQRPVGSIDVAAARV